MAHVTSGSRITSIHEVSVICRGTLSGSTISTDGNPNYLSKSSQYLLRSLYIHVTGGNNGVWNIKERNRVEMSILWGNGNITGAGQACYKSNRYLLRPTLVRFIINISSS